MNKKLQFEKINAIETALKKMGWHTEISYSNSDTGSISRYIEIYKEIEDGTEFGDTVTRKIRISDHDLPSKYPPADYDISYEDDSWRKLKPVLKKLYDTETIGDKKRIK